MGMTNMTRSFYSVKDQTHPKSLPEWGKMNCSKSRIVSFRVSDSLAKRRRRIFCTFISTLLYLSLNASVVASSIEEYDSLNIYGTSSHPYSRQQQNTSQSQRRKDILDYNISSSSRSSGTGRLDETGDRKHLSNGKRRKKKKRRKKIHGTFNLPIDSVNGLQENSSPKVIADTITPPKRKTKAKKRKKKSSGNSNILPESRIHSSDHITSPTHLPHPQQALAGGSTTAALHDVPIQQKEETVRTQKTNIENNHRSEITRPHQFPYNAPPRPQGQFFQQYPQQIPQTNYQTQPTIPKMPPTPSLISQHQQRPVPTPIHTQTQNTSINQTKRPSTSSTGTTQWIREYLSTHRRDHLLPVPRDFIVDGFNLQRLQDIVEAAVPPSSPGIFRAALRLILDQKPLTTANSKIKTAPQVTGPNTAVTKASTSKPTPLFPPEEVQKVAAEILYPLIHSRFVVSPRGLLAVNRALRQNGALFGRCPRQFCKGNALLPCGFSDSEVGKGRCMRYCCSCGEILYMWDSSVDGCAWGTSFCHLLLMVYGKELFPSLVNNVSDVSSIQIVPISLTQYDRENQSRSLTTPTTPSIFGFRVHPTEAAVRYPICKRVLMYNRQKESVQRRESV